MRTRLTGAPRTAAVREDVPREDVPRAGADRRIRRIVSVGRDAA
ncbi:hypothetical protein [Streptomyces ferrugineus]|nr:hypothetical protein [Streptomyces ferrugineus]